MGERLVGATLPQETNVPLSVDEAIWAIERLWDQFFNKELTEDERKERQDNLLNDLPETTIEELMGRVGPRGETRLQMAVRKIVDAREKRPPKSLRIYRRRQLAEERRKGNGRF